MKNHESLQVQYIAYEVDTHDSTRLEQLYAHWVNSRYAVVVNPPAGFSSDQKAQWSYFQFLTENLRQIILHHGGCGHIDTVSQGMLAVFAAPEFYFKDRGNQPFDEAVYRAGLTYLNQRLSGLGNLIIFAGSIWWWERYQGPNGANATIHNTVPVFFQGQNILNWNKKFLSNIDGLGQANANWGPSTHWDTVTQQALGVALEQNGASPVVVVNVGGVAVSLGVEVCLEHCYAYLRNHNNGHLDIHMLVCAGIPKPSPAALANRAGGLFLRTDGGIAGAGYPYDNNRSNCLQSAVGGALVAVAGTAYPSLPDRPSMPDERLMVYPPVTLNGPS